MDNIFAVMIVDYRQASIFRNTTAIFYYDHIPVESSKPFFYCCSNCKLFALKVVAVAGPRSFITGCYLRRRRGYFFAQDQDRNMQTVVLFVKCLPKKFYLNQLCSLILLMQAHYCCIHNFGIFV